MIRAIGFVAGQYGDLVISTAVARAFKQACPDSHLTLGINQRYQKIAPLFQNHPFFDDIHIYQEYDQWPGREDVEYLAKEKFDMVFNAMPKVPYNWFRHMHQTKLAGYVHGINVADETCVLNRWFDVPDLGKTVAIAPFAGWYNPSNKKKLSTENAQKIVDYLRGRGYNVIKLGGEGEPELVGADNQVTSYLESIQRMLGCKLLIHTDTASGWICSAYKHPQLGLYSHEYYGEEFVQNIQPRNLNGVYLSSNSVNDENFLDKVTQTLDNLLP